MHPRLQCPTGLRLHGRVPALRLIRFFCLHFLLVSAASAQWRPVEVPGRVLTSQFARYGDTLFTAGTEIYRSVDRGETWSYVQEGLGGGNKLSVLNKDGTLFVSAYANNLFRSRDGGVTWDSASEGITGSFVSKLAADGRDLYVATDLEGLFHSVDDGAHWVAVNGNLPTRPVPGLEARYEIMDYIVTGGRIFAATLRDGLYRSDDRGRTWEITGTGLPVGEMYALCQAGTSVFAGVGAEVYRTGDEGRTWSRVGMGVIDSLVFSLTFEKGRLYAGTRVGNFQSSDTGRTWASVPGLLSVSPMIYDTEVADDTWLAATSEGVYRSLDDGKTWKPGLAGTRSADIASLVPAEGFLYAALRYQTSIVRIADPGPSSSVIGPNPPADVFSLAEADGTLYAGTANGLMVTADSGRTWKSLGPKGRSVYQLAARGKDVYAGTFDSLYHSGDGGGTWTRISDSLMGAGLFPNRIHRIGFHDGELFAAVQPTGLFRSADRGNTWALLPGTDTLEVRGFESGATSLFVTGHKGVFRSRNGGGTWERLGSPSPATAIGKLLVTGNHVFAGTERGLAFSADQGDTWRLADAGWVPDMAVLARNGSYLYFGSMNWGLWRRSLSEFFPVATSPSGSGEGIRGEGSRARLIFPGLHGGLPMGPAKGGKAFDIRGRKHPDADGKNAHGAPLVIPDRPR